MQTPQAPLTFSVELIAKQALAALGTVSGLAAIAYAVGYLNRWSFFDTFGAAWLVTDIGIAEILPASVNGLLPIVLLAAVALVQSAERFQSESKLKGMLMIWCALAVLFILLDRRGGRLFTLDARALFSLAASFSVIFASVA